MGIQTEDHRNVGENQGGQPGQRQHENGLLLPGATEHCLFAVRGKMRLNVRNLPTAFLWPRIGQHSRKPDAFFEMVETATPGPRLELFARRPREGWTVWGNEVEAND